MPFLILFISRSSRQIRLSLYTVKCHVDVMGEGIQCEIKWNPEKQWSFCVLLPKTYINKKHDTQLFLVLCCLLLLLFWWQGLNVMMLYYAKLARKNVQFSSISSKILPTPPKKISPLKSFNLQSYLKYKKYALWQSKNM